MKNFTKISLFLVSALMILGIVTINSCKKDDKLPQINGYDNSNQVASTYLKAHWTFDETYNEAISATAPTNKYGTYGFEAGQIGKALKLTVGSVVYPSIPNIGSANSLSAFTVSMWVNVKGTKYAGGAFTAFFSLVPTAVTSVWGNINALAETGWHTATSDTLVLKNLMVTQMPDLSLNTQDNLATLGDAAGQHFMGAKKWSLYVMTWDASTHQFMIYGDGESIGAYSDRGTTPAMVLRTPCQAVFGSLPATDIGFASAEVRGGWFPMATASIDDVRIYNTALSQVEITALYNLGIAGR